jgi:hypothetical protein
VRDELQELVDRVAGLLGAPATLEDADLTLLAFCAHPVDGAETPVMDAVRTRSILGRGSTPATRRWFEDFGIAVSEGPLRTPGDPDAGILTRLVLPVRHAGRTYGYLWLLDGGRTDPAAADDPALAGAVELAAEAGRLLAEREEDAGDLARPLATALTGASDAQAQVVRTLTAAWTWPTATRGCCCTPRCAAPGCRDRQRPHPPARILRSASRRTLGTSLRWTADNGGHTTRPMRRSRCREVVHATRPAAVCTSISALRYQEAASSRIRSSPRAPTRQPPTVTGERPRLSRSPRTPRQMHHSATLGTSPNIARAHCSGVASTSVVSTNRSA